MKQLGARVALILGLSLAAWVLLYLLSSPPTPPGGSETVGLVIVVGALVIAGQWVISRVRGGRQR